jgi:hypothetical protein
MTAPGDYCMTPDTQCGEGSQAIMNQSRNIADRQWWTCRENARVLRDALWSRDASNAGRSGKRGRFMTVKISNGYT